MYQRPVDQRLDESSGNGAPKDQVLGDTSGKNVGEDFCIYEVPENRSKKTHNLVNSPPIIRQEQNIAILMSSISGTD